MLRSISWCYLESQTGQQIRGRRRTPVEQCAVTQYALHTVGKVVTQYTANRSLVGAGARGSTLARLVPVVDGVLDRRRARGAGGRPSMGGRRRGRSALRLRPWSRRTRGFPRGARAAASSARGGDTSSLRRGASSSPAATPRGRSSRRS